jgi:hypothetical protein
MAQPVVAVVNTNPDVVELLKARIEACAKRRCTDDSSC